MKYPIKQSREDRLCKTIQMRRDIVEMTHTAKSGHPGGSLSATDMLVVLYNEVLKHDTDNPKWEDRDRMIFCKCHITPAIYSILSRTGYFDPKMLSTFRQFGSELQGHPFRLHPRGIEMSGGSLGQNLSIMAGVALGLRHQGKENRVYGLSSEGDLQEGQSWEAIMSAAHYELDNMCLLVDYNKLQIDGHVEDVMGIAPLAEKFRAFNWHVIEIDGHDCDAIYESLEKSKTLKGRPTVIIGDTIKGKGISFMENQAGWHGKAPNDEELAKALSELLEVESQIDVAKIS